MMTEIKTIEGGQKDVSSIEGTTLKNKYFFNVNVVENFSISKILSQSS